VDGMNPSAKMAPGGARTDAFVMECRRDGDHYNPCKLPAGNSYCLVEKGF
jgi:hypothetical protein